MINNEKNAGAIISKIENTLKDLKIKSETMARKEEAAIYGKFSIENNKYNIVIHIQKEGFEEKSQNHGEQKFDKSDEECGCVPTMDFQAQMSKHKSYSEEEGLKIKENFLKKASEIVRKM